MDRRQVLAFTGALVAAGGSLAALIFLGEQDTSPSPTGPPPDELDVEAESTHPVWGDGPVVVTSTIVDWIDDQIDWDYHERFEAAVDAWNAYIDAEAPYDLSIRYERDVDDPTLRIPLESFPNGDECTPEYATLDSGRWWRGEVMDWICGVETVTIDPGHPVEVTIGDTGRGVGVFQYLIEFAIGATLGYQPGEARPDAMDHRLLAGPIQPSNNPYAQLSIHWLNFTGEWIETELADDSETLADAPGELRPRDIDFLAERTEHLGTSMNEMLRAIAEHYREDRDQPLLAEAVELLLIGGEDIAVIDEAVYWLTALVDEAEAAGISFQAHDAPYTDFDAYEPAVDATEAVLSLRERHEPWDLRIHRYWAESVWAERMD